ncbi:hypothetical protein H6P81_001787 [Aristolochia fimbriata]|uniref:Bidirectional sugar transporter SWEET n=1 Tax=Aristolochia fimbriata TaxID=158543 RepID=A0AAV7F9E1_ARIFI|nr:hypothetical protein H6P81_001787 [Aristolochia fimbriata]
MAVLHFLFGIFGNATALFLFLAPLITFRRIVKSKSTEEFSGIPYVTTLLNCLLSAWYGLPFVSPHNLLVSTINGTGALIESIYVVVFLVYSRGKVRAKILGLFLLVLSFFALVALVSLFALHGQKRKLFCGFAAAIFSICMYASPLSIMRMVIRTKSVEYMPFFLSLFVFLCGTSWFIYGLLGSDPFITVPNGFGSGLGALQLVLYAIYRKGGKAKDGALELAEPVKTADGKMSGQDHHAIKPQDNQFQCMVGTSSWGPTSYVITWRFGIGDGVASVLLCLCLISN